MKNENKIIDFDSFAQEYAALHAENVKVSGYSVSYFAEYKIKEIARYLTLSGLAHKTIDFLNFGCGIGNSEEFIRKYLPNSRIYSVDQSPKSIDYARGRHRELPDIHFDVIDGRSIPFKISFDVILISNVLHHVSRFEQLDILRLLNKSLKHSGLLFLFEHNPFNPLTVKAVRECPFDEGVVLLSPFYSKRLLRQASFGSPTLNFVLFFPKWLKYLNPLQRYLRKIPFGAQYYLVTTKSS